MCFRAMNEDADGKPVVGDGANMLGVRPSDTKLNNRGQVVPGTGGMSVGVASPWYLPNHRRPISWKDGSRGRPPMVMYRVREEDLESRGLVLSEDRLGHGSVEPNSACPLAAYKDRLSSTKNHWRVVEPFPRDVRITP